MSESWTGCLLGDVVLPENKRVGDEPAPMVLSSTKHHGLVPARDYFKGRQVHGDDLTAYRIVEAEWFAYATNHLAEGSIGLNKWGVAGCVSPMYTVFSARECVDEEYLYLLLKSPALLNQYNLLEQASVSRRGSIRYASFASIPILLPSWEEQRRIAEILDAADQSIRAAERVITKLTRIRRGKADHLLNSLPLNSLLATGLKRIDAGWSPSCIDRPPLGREWGVLKVSSVTTEIFDASESKTLPSELRCRPELVTKVGDVLTARANGVADLVARTAIVDDLDDKNLMISDKTLRLVPVPTLSARYLTLCMQHEMVRSQVRRLVAGSTGQGNVSQDELLSLRIAIPDLEQQKKIEQALAAIDARIATEHRYSNKLRQLSRGVAADLLSGRIRTVAK